MIIALPLLASLAAAQMSDPAPESVKRLHDEFVESIKESPRTGILEKLEKTVPETPADVDALYDLFMRFSDERVRRASLSSLKLINPSSPYLIPIFERYLGQPEPESKLFALKGVLLLRDEKALPQVRALAEKKFPVKRVEDAVLMGERNAFWVQYEALGDLAQWRPAEALPLLIKRSAESPTVARLIGTYLWKEGFDKIVEWSKAESAEDRERAERALAAPTPLEALRATREPMLAILRDPKAPADLRHQLALKLGLSTTPAEVPALLKDYDDASDDQSKLMFAAALFGTRDPRVVPLLTKFLKENPEPNVRAGALIQLQDLLPAKDFKPLAQWVSQNDPEESNRKAAVAALDKLKTP